MWIKYKSQLPLVDQIKFTRKIINDENSTHQVYGFCDASMQAFGAVLYLRSTIKYYHTTVQLVCSKTRVAPIKTLTLPRLELCAAMLFTVYAQSSRHVIKRSLSCPVIVQPPLTKRSSLVIKRFNTWAEKYTLRNTIIEITSLQLSNHNHWRRRN